MSSNSSIVSTLPYYYTYLNFAENTLAFICTLIAIIHMSKLFYASKFNKSSLRVDNLAGTMKVYLAVNIFCGTLTLPYFFYKVFWWRPLLCMEMIQYIQIIFYALHYGVSSSLHYGNKIRQKIVIIEIIIFKKLNKIIYCESQSCMQLHLKNYPILFVKTCFGVGNIFCCIVFLHLLARVGKEAKKKLDNRIIKITVLIEIFLNMIPGEGNIIYKFITGTTPSTYTGELALLGFSLEIAICSVFYWRKYKYSKNEIQVKIIKSQENIQKKFSNKDIK
ncbi:hypothetical protein Mgra_00008098 [Meloidogyne graminicola]|uniref:Uncharacterized protein n=1 Tax=Meloidogyne graminicola TaxID=189291 RepID=A0A8S9ZGP5_9BILA|nr:hypothetical protein Mgra_00008098 [Meloidogyne graminicola]